MRRYELTIILSPNLEKNDLEKVLDKVKKIIEDASGKVAEVKVWGKKQLAYPLKKQKEGIFFWLTFDLDGKEANIVKNKLNLEEQLLRFLIIRKE